MKKINFEANDKVKILDNRINPEYIGKFGVIKSVKHIGDQSYYKVKVGEKVLDGYALPEDLEKV